MRYTLTWSCLLLVSQLLQGCAPVWVAGAAAGISLANDRRTPGAFIDDQDIEIHVRNALKADNELANDTHFSVTSFNHVVLLTGQVRDQQQRNLAAELASATANIKRIHNEIQIAAPTSTQDRNQDTWLTTKVKSALSQHASLNAMNIKVVTENSLVYLMGLVSQAEAEAAATTAQQVGDVKGVIKVFEYID
jgi:osmotically-inducible protein OsmY